ncbi:bromodomain-containing protein 4 [Cocos nucifera]|uniref:Bromodomain-containing protein 4 n=1 Tax=Cocos nucifera TaxID=13894 RepID=A0A8K0NB62_COCNU|nr:bromodomain-containing protein 4 [Cocos nucifera]
MEVERSKLRDESHLSSAYIRSLVKQLSSSRSKAPAHPKSPNIVIGDGLSQDLAKHTQCTSEVQQQQSPPPPPQSQPSKKQVRRRLHTSRPYQERILNMAEARREIVAALKFHRAATKQANEEQQQDHQQQKQEQDLTPSSALYPSPPTLEEPHQGLIDSRRNIRLYPPNYTYPYYHQYPSFSPFLHPSPVWAYPSIPPPSIADDLDLPLPNQPLGLNLNIQGFNNLDMSFCNNNTNNPPIQPSPSSSCSSYSYSSPPTMSGLEIPSILDVSPHASDVASDPISTIILHPVMDNEEIAEIRSVGEQYDMEWNDTMNLFTSIWWSKFLKNMEGSRNERITGAEEDRFHVFNEFLDTPSWLSDGYSGDIKDSYLLQQQQQMDDYNPTEDYLKDVALPCLDIGEIESWDPEWLS